ncbi:hypothetical protein Pcinc_024073 [Petrolisthes cinctipes]|uniref:Peroxisome assembly protein 12 n=1 Tax=Petrolisthes cinctipes TaxID=88211 RepID=A0AAE1FCU2_PETCI|nr:hypothetical protein Pcinc_024073 [Petrolisthes cinctipes]
MAEYGAHITITASDRPSIFDVVAQDGLMSTLQPAVNHIMRVLAERNPERYGFLLRFSDEIFVLFNTIIQHHYIKNYGASFAENFYDLKRVELKNKNSNKPLTLSHQAYYKSMFTLVTFPYLRNRLDQLFQRIQERHADNALSEESWKCRIQRLFLKMWPVLHFSWEFLTFVYYVRYAVGKSRFHSPLLPLSGVQLATLDHSDYEVIDARTEMMLAFRNVRSGWELGRWAVECVGSSLMNSLEVGAFFLQFLDWFYSSGNTPTTFNAQPIPPPPQSVGIQKVCGLNNTDCPICFKIRKYDTVLSVSGYVFCYGCILPYVRREGKCPVTGYPASTTQLIRIYHET